MQIQAENTASVAAETVEVKARLQVALACIAELEAEVKMWRDENFKKQTAYQRRGVRIAELEVALRGLLTPQTPAAFADAMRVARAALAGGKKDE